MSQDIKEMTLQLVLKAEEGEHREWEFVRSRREYSGLKAVIGALKGFCKRLKAAAKEADKACAKEALDDTRKPDTAAVARKMKEILGFYLQELETAEDMAKEYRCYFRSNRLSQLLGDERPESHLVDYRTLPFSWPWTV